MQKPPLITAIALTVLLVSCGGKQDSHVTVGGTGDILKEETIKMAIPHGKLIDPLHGAEEWFAIGAISGKEGTPANGVIQGHYFADGTYVLNMQLNIARIEKDGTFYQAWLVPETGNWIEAGRPSSRFGDARHFVSEPIAKDVRSSLKVTVTLEQDDGNPAPSGTVVAEGIMKVTKR